MAKRVILSKFVVCPETIAEERPSEIIYQVYPASFADANGDGHGDLPGITEKLDHIASLGVDAVWISPFFRSPPGVDGDGGYAVSDYRRIGERFGAIEDFVALLGKAHELGLRIYIDFVLPHTSNEHEWFSKSRARQAPYEDYYVWQDGGRDASGRRSPPNNWLSVFGGPAWSLDAARDQWYMHHFLKSQPALNLNLPKVQDATLGEMRFWLDMGVDGFRIDALPFANYDPQLRDDGWLDPAKTLETGGDWHDMYLEHSCCQPETKDLIRRMRALFDSYPDKRTVLGEVLSGPRGSGSAVPTAADYVDSRHGLDICYTDAILSMSQYPSPSDLKRMLEHALRHFPPDGGHCNAASNHDRQRSATRMTGQLPPASRGVAMRQLLQLFLALPGSFCLYQGEELGLPEARVPEDIPIEKLKDPVATTQGIARGRDGCRTPMPWRAGAPNAGFSISEDPYLPVPESHLALAVDRQLCAPDSSLLFTRRLIAWRKAQPALARGQTVIIDTTGSVFAFLRIARAQTMLCLFNMSGELASFRPADHLDATLLGRLGYPAGQTLQLEPHGACFIGAFEPTQI